MTAINTNVKSLIAQQSLTVNNRSLSKAMEQLSTGKRINSAADDAAGLAISNKMTAQVRGLNQAVRNANDAISMVQTAEGALNEVTNMLQRMRELAVQSVNGTYSTSDRASLDAEFDQLSAEISRISDKTTWNGKEIVGSAAASTDFQVGPGASDTVTVTFSNVSTLGGIVSAAGEGLDSAVSATSAIVELDQAISTVDAYRSTLGAMVNRLNYAADNLTNVATNTSASRSRILDTDYAATTTELARTQIIQQAATAMLAQANQSPSSVLSLLQQ
ncbi:flagellin [Limnohabitans sp. Rim8]|uniref:flagellin N-terminal helical domain-containing protein n=1 Tax=Limnohabitans sp. Rim8 TaxID=1100718 RepID=UPI0025E7199A|nr:flagellin [Limnohabitans sp. Rim8]